MNSRNSVLTAQNSLLYRPTVPPYCTALLAQNAPSKSLGPPLLDVRSDPPPLTVSQFAQQRQAGAMVLDCRSPEVFASPIPSAINVGLGSSFTTWAGSVLLRDVPLVLVLARSQDLWTVCWQLLRIGYDLPKDWLSGGMKAWRTAAKDITLMPLWDIHVLKQQLQRDDDLFVLDVRQPEWRVELGTY
ncbi:MAG: Rhodanese-related sulfurtransferase [Phormidesmis priestleyi Ana]|uniref:Rhodanese-related sulfurtransferase n=1 Tax=Phormidesmis priestleyi Ana TaxID=1666911 RepID=A0A0P7ZJA9_9CYAN|nr:MAG: Rhodanese-related sulfurtransferase [Phormidesmis priestleyi Ana]